MAVSQKINTLTLIPATNNNDHIYIMDASNGDADHRVKLSALFDHPRSFGSIYVANGSSGQSITPADTWVDINQFVADGESQNMTLSHANDRLTITATGIYRVNFTCSFSGTASRTFSVRAKWNSIAQDQLRFTRTLGTGGSVGCAGFTGYLDVSFAGAHLKLEVRCEGSTGTFTMEEGSLLAERVGDT